MSDEGHEWSKGWTTTVHTGFQVFSPTRLVYTTGPATWSIDEDRNLHISETLTDGCEVEVALFLAGSFTSVTQQMDEDTEPEDEEPEDEDEIQVINGDGGEDTPW